MHQPHHGVGEGHACQCGTFSQLQPQLLVLRILEDERQGIGDLLYRHQGQRIAHRVFGGADKGLDGMGHGIHGGSGGDVEGQSLSQTRVEHRQLRQQEGGGEGHLAPTRLILDHRHQRYLGTCARRGGHHRQRLEGAGQAARARVVEQVFTPHGCQDIDRLGGIDDRAAPQCHQTVAI